MGDGCADLTLDVVSDDRHPGLCELLRPNWIGSYEDRKCIDECDLGVESALRVELSGLLGSDRQVTDEDVNPLVLECLDHIDLRGC